MKQDPTKTESEVHLSLLHLRSYGFLEKVHDDPNAFVYVTVTAADGSYATTRAYFLNELV